MTTLTTGHGFWIGVALVALTCGLSCTGSGCQAGAGPGSGSDSQMERLRGDWEVANGSERETCGDQAHSAPLRRRVWFHPADRGQLLRLQDDSLCELRFRVDANGARVVPGQWCESYGYDEDGALIHRRLVPRSWSIRPVEPRELGLYREAYELQVIRTGRKGPVEPCAIVGVATLAPPDLR